MSDPAEVVADLLRRGRAARVRGDADAARAAFAKAYDLAREHHDATGMGEAALGLATGYVYGTHPGRVPAFLFEAYSLAQGVARTRLAAALVRAWVYSGSSDRAVPFAEEAIAGAEASGDAPLLAEALDAQLLVHWGPDDLDERLRITTRLEDTVAHLADPEARMSAHLWRMTTAMEMLDLPTLRRQLRALQDLADETGSDRVRFFSEARNAMHALVVGDLDAARRHRDAALVAGNTAGEPDAFAIQHVLAAAIAVQAGDRDTILAEAAISEEFANGEGVLTVGAESAQLWVEGGALDRARAAVVQLARAGLAGIPRDGDWLLVITCLTSAAAAAGLRDVAAEGYELLEPYAGRGVANGGAATFGGVVDGFLSTAAATLGREVDANRWTRSAGELAERFGAEWWARRYLSESAAASNVPVSTGSVSRAVLRKESDGVWTVGREGATQAVREMKGFAYLQLLVREPGVEISALDLSDWVAGHAGEGTTESATDEVIDRQALSAYRLRLREIDTELDEVTEWGDRSGIERLEDERDALLAEVRAATGLGGRGRRTGGSAERARIAVRKALAAAIDRIAAVDGSLGRLLADCVQTGAMCRYSPDPDRPVTWTTDRPGS